MVLGEEEGGKKGFTQRKGGGERENAFGLTREKVADQKPFRGNHKQGGDKEEEGGDEQ